MPRPPKRHSPDFKARVAVEAIRGLKTTAQLAREFQVHPVPISPWKRQALDRLPEAFGREASSGQRSEDFHCLTHRIRQHSMSLIDQFFGLLAGLWNFKAFNINSFI